MRTEVLQSYEALDLKQHFKVHVCMSYPFKVNVPQTAVIN